MRQSVMAIKGVGVERAATLAQLGIHTIEDLLLYFPYRYEDRRIQDLAEAIHNEKVTVQGVIHSPATVRFYGKRKSRLTVKVLVDRYLLTAVIFNRHFLKNKLSIGQSIRITGKLDKHRMQMAVQDFSLRPPKEGDQEESLLPIYHVTSAISNAYLRKIVHQALEQFGSAIPEIIPTALVQRYRLMSRREAIQLLHSPGHAQDGKWAKRRMVYEELFLFQLKIQAFKKIQRENQKGIAQAIDQDKVDQFISSLPFSLTSAQQKVCQEIIADLRSDYAMNRLLQGDVGSGKTVVSAIAMFASVNAGYQAALMVPTEILAEQHYHSLQTFFREESIHISLLTGNTKAKERRDILAGLQMGTIDVVVGTHALIQDDIIFRQLGVVVTDEQHRFGVDQRRRLRQKGVTPDVLFMSATPIPRTLAITAFGDLDVSVIDQLPAGRKPVETYWVKENAYDRVLAFIEKEVGKGRQAFFVCPIIEESETLDVQNVVDLHALLIDRFPKYHVGFIHSKLPVQEKEQLMKRFADHDLHVLVSTTVVEVGINVPNATLMVVQDAERFGLSQLHQLRGRVGRGKHQAYCILIADPKTEAGKERMRTMQMTNDGFEVARKDLELRGPGDFFGTKQSGLPEFKLADLIHDHKVLEVAREDAGKLIASTAFWTDPRYVSLRLYLQSEGIVASEKLD